MYWSGIYSYLSINECVAVLCKKVQPLYLSMFLAVTRMSQLYCYTSFNIILMFVRLHLDHRDFITLLRIFGYFQSLRSLFVQSFGLRWTFIFISFIWGFFMFVRYFLQFKTHSIFCSIYFCSRRITIDRIPMCHPKEEDGLCQNTKNNWEKIYIVGTLKNKLMLGHPKRKFVHFDKI